MTNFFELSSPRDMFQKAKREHEHMRQTLNTDTVFNFFVTVYHIKDYVEVSKAVPTPDLVAFLDDPELKFARSLCNKGKHLKLTRRDPGATMWSGLVGGAPVGAVMVNSGDVYVLLVDGHSPVDVDLLASRVLEKWEQFLLKYGLF